MAEEKKEEGKTASDTATPEQNLTKALGVLEEITKSGLTVEDVQRLEKGKKSSKKAKSESEDDGDESEAEKSLMTELEEDDTIRKGFEVSEFLEKSMEIVSGSVDTLSKSLHQSVKQQTMVNDAMSKSLKAVGDVLTEISGRLKKIEDTPIGTRKSALSKGETREMGGAGGEGRPGLPTKKAILGFLESEVLTKSMNGVTPMDVARFEQLNETRPEVKALIHKHFNISAA